MSWYRLLMMFLPVVNTAILIAERVTSDKQLRRRFLKRWVHAASGAMEAAAYAIEDELDDIDETLNTETL